MNERADIAVVGSGAAGIAAAVTAARAGCGTILFDQKSSGGGTGGFSGLTTLCGLYDGEARFLNEGFVREFAEAIAEAAPLKMGRVWVLQYRPERFRALAMDFFAKTPGLRTRWNSPLASAVVEGGRIVSINGVNVGAVIDCSGTAEVARAIGAACYSTDESTQASAIIFPLSHVHRDMLTPAAAAQVMMPLARAGFPPISLQSGLDPDTLTVKFTGHAEQVPALIEFLRKNVSGFERCSTSLRVFEAARRMGRMIIGGYVLTGADVLGARKFPDAVARCAWPIEQWNAEGVVHFRYLPAGAWYEIPARSLHAASVENLFMAGKTISADAEAIASARVMGCCLATGEAAAKLAAKS